MKKYKHTTTLTYQGKRYYIRADTKAELVAKKALKLRDLEDGKIVINSNVTLSAWAETCIEAYKTNQSEVTREKFEQRVRHCILDSIGAMRLCDIRPIHLQTILNEQAGKSPTQINTVYQAVRFLFSHAVANELLSSDPSLKLTKPKAKKPVPRRALTPEEREIIIRVGATDRRWYYFLLMLYCGCRPSEAMACKGQSIVSIDGYNLLYIKGSKSLSAERHVPIPDEFYRLIANTPEDEPIATTASGPVTVRNRNRLWRSFKRELNLALGCKTYRNQLIPPFPLADDLYPYCLRHEYCTELARRGVDIRTAQKLMGHSSVTLTANIYTNLTERDTLTAADLLGATSGATS